MLGACTLRRELLTPIPHTSYILEYEIKDTKEWS